MKIVDFKKLDANWIWIDNRRIINTYVRFIHDFNLAEIKDIKLLISADTDYVAYINGQLVGYGQYDDYPFYKVFDEYEIGNLLKIGRNRLCILGYYQGVDSFQYYKADEGIVFAVLAGNAVLASSGQNTLSSICLMYESGDVENVSPQLAFTFKYNATKDDNWLEESYNTDCWDNCIVINKDMNLYQRPIKKLITKYRVDSRLCAQGLFIRNKHDCDIGLLMFQDYLSARRIPEISNWNENEVILKDINHFCVRQSQTEGRGVYLVFDLGREEVGLLDIELDTAEGTVFEIGYSEHLDDLRVRSYTGGRNFACRYVSKEGRQCFTHYFKRVGCRYVQLNISNIKEDIRIYYTGVLPVCYPLTDRSIDIKDRLHRRIYEIAVRTLELCMHEHYEDCPWREQALYAMDSRNQALCGYYCFEEYDFPESCIRLLALNLDEDGMLELCAPARIPITIPSFTFIWVLELYEFWKHSGRTGFIREMFETLKKICSSALIRMEDGMITCYQETKYWNFYEWADGLDGVPIFRDYQLKKRYDAPLNMFLIIALDRAVQLASAVNENHLAEYWADCAELLRRTTKESFCDKESGLYYTYKDDEKRWHISELTQTLAICCGCANGKESEELRKVIIDKDNGLVPVTLSYMAFKYDVLFMDFENYGKWAFNNIAKIWGDMLFKGATSFWETQKGACDFENAGSLCHGWSAMPAFYYHRFGHLINI